MSQLKVLTQDMKTSRRPIVYLIAQPTVSRRKAPPNLTPLYKHGEVVTLLIAGEQPAFRPSDCFESLETRFQNFDPDVDFLVWAGGDVLAAVMVGMLLSERDIYHFKWLRYERFRLPNGDRVDEGAKYEEVEIDLRDPQYDLLGTGERDDDEIDEDGERLGQQAWRTA